ncbi:MAG: hypothetical protein WB507_02350 [Solirubrobacterales bacterium]
MVPASSLRGLVTRLSQMRRPWPGALAPLLGGLVLIAFSSTPALADSPFSWSPPVNVDGISPIDSVSCPSTSLCVAGDSAGNVVTSTNPTGGEAAWAYPIWVDNPLESSIEALHDLSCVSAPSLLCAAVDQTGHVVTSTEPTGGAATWHIVSLPGSEVDAWGISCTSSLCVIVGNDEHGGNLFSSTDPTGSGSAWNPVSLKDHGEPVGQIYGVSCPSESLCVAAGSGSTSGAIYSSTSPTSGTATAWTPADIAKGLPYQVSCASTSLCVATDGPGEIITSTEPTQGTSAWKFADIDGENDLNGVSCTASPTLLCVVTDQEGNVITSTNPTGGPSAWTVTDIDGENQPTAVSCPSTSLCVAGDEDGNILVAPFTSSTGAGGGGGGGGGGSTENPPALQKKPLKCKKGFKKKKVHGKTKCVKVKHKKHKH